MEKISIVCESNMTKLAKSLAKKLEPNDNQITFICRDRFPKADVMFPFLQNLSDNFDRSLLIISGKQDSILSTWISQELKMQHSLGILDNTCPVFVTKKEIQPWWQKQKNILVLSEV